jgi:hypothetical protein
MWTNVAILFLFVLFFLAVGILKQKEGFDNPTTVSQQQQGDLATFQKQLTQITVTDELLNTIQQQITQLSNQTTKLQVNLPGQADKYN